MTDILNTWVTLLMRLSNQHDDHAWSEFVDYYKKFIYLVIRGMNIQHADAEDITQDILIKLWNILPDFKYNKKKGSFRSWLGRITRNSVIDFIRRNKNNHEQVDPQDLDSNSCFQKYATQSEVDMLIEKEWERYMEHLF